MNSFKIKDGLEYPHMWIGAVQHPTPDPTLTRAEYHYPVLVEKKQVEMVEDAEATNVQHLSYVLERTEKLRQKLDEYITKLKEGIHAATKKRTAQGI